MNPHARAMTVPATIGLETIELRFNGRFSLIDSVSLATGASFVGGLRSDPDHSGSKVLDLAFPLERSWDAVGVRIGQTDGRVFATVVANPHGAALDDIRAQLKRILSLDVDGAGFDDLAAGDDAIARLQMRTPGLRTVLFSSPYEAAARAIIGHGLPVRYAAALHARIASNIGVGLDMGDHVAYAFPAPTSLARLTGMHGLADRKIEQLRNLGAAATRDRLDSSRLRAMSRETALGHLQKLPGVGPFSAELILLRGIGDPDAFPLSEKKLHRAMAIAYGLGDDPTVEKLQRIAEQWRPYRSWVGLLLRNG